MFSNTFLCDEMDSVSEIIQQQSLSEPLIIETTSTSGTIGRNTSSSSSSSSLSPLQSGSDISLHSRRNHIRSNQHTHQHYQQHEHGTIVMVGTLLGCNNHSNHQHQHQHQQQSKSLKLIWIIIIVGCISIMYLSTAFDSPCQRTMLFLRIRLILIRWFSGKTIWQGSECCWEDTRHSFAYWVFAEMPMKRPNAAEQM